MFIRYLIVLPVVIWMGMSSMPSSGGSGNSGRKVCLLLTVRQTTLSFLSQIYDGPRWRHKWSIPREVHSWRVGRVRNEDIKRLDIVKGVVDKVKK